MSAAVTSSRRAVAMHTQSPRILAASAARAQSSAARCLSTTAASSSSTLYSRFSSSYPSVRYPLLAVGASLLAAQQLHFHSTAHASAASTPPAAATTTTTTPTPPASNNTTPPLPTFDLTTLHYYSLEAFRSSATIRLYQYQTCPFCNKVRAYLDWANIPYEVIEVNPMGKKELTGTGMKAVPVVTVDHIVMNESSAIITAFDELLTYYRVKQQQRSNTTASASASASSSTYSSTPSSSATPATSAASSSSPSSSSAAASTVASSSTTASSPAAAASSSPSSVDYWRNWVDTKLIYLTAPNLYTSLSASLRAMDYIMTQSQLPTSQRYLSKYVGGPMMYLVSEYKLKKKRNITDARTQLYQALREWTSEAVEQRGKGGGFSGGMRPDLSDVAVYGVCRAFMGFPAGEDIMRVENVGSGFVEWYGRMEREVGESKAKNRMVGGTKVGPDFVRQEAERA